MTLQELFAKAEAAIATIETQSGELIDKGADFLDGAAAWLRDQKAGLKMAAPSDAKKCQELLDRCHKCCPPGVEPKNHPKAAGPLLKIVMNLIAQLLQDLLQSQTPS